MELDLGLFVGFVCPIFNAPKNVPQQVLNFKNKKKICPKLTAFEKIKETL